MANINVGSFRRVFLNNAIDNPALEDHTYEQGFRQELLCATSVQEIFDVFVKYVRICALNDSEKEQFIRTVEQSLKYCHINASDFVEQLRAEHL